MTDRISGSAFKQMIAFGAARVAQQKQAINDLNVFPVPDGDTGTNMSLTIQTAVNELKKSEPATVGEAAKITAGALLRGARGNSGVILSLLFRGIPSPPRAWWRWTARPWPPPWARAWPPPMAR